VAGRSVLETHGGGSEFLSMVLVRVAADVRLARESTSGHQKVCVAGVRQAANR
jgi:hypothetical protein